MLASRAGLNVASIRYLVDGLRLAKFALSGWKKDRGPLYLRISRSALSDRTEVDIVPGELGSPTTDLTIVIDLAQLWARIKASPE